MRIITLLFALLAISSCHLNVNSPPETAPPPSSPAPVDYKEIEAIMIAQTDEWNKGNVDGFMLGYWNSPELKFITSRGVTLGYDSMANGYKRNYNTPEKMGNLTFTNLIYTTLDADNQIVHCSGRWNVSSATEKQQSGIFSLIFRKIDNQWKIIIDHTW